MQNWPSSTFVLCHKCRTEAEVDKPRRDLLADDHGTPVPRRSRHLSGVVRLVEEFRGRIVARQDPGFDAAVATAVAEIRAARRTDR
ncbi:hypothetical protein ABT187_08080 [Streptomyces sp. NPDC001817]|uniref:hypothetical protein n=1 Tax=Streptomyces sp. NPDC001817 TaxID=3154398 RepID=UPI00332258A1